MDKRIYSLIGILLGIAMIITGFIVRKNPPESYSTSTAESASFGADFYTYTYRGIRYVAQNTSTIANNIRELGEKITSCISLAFIFAGGCTLVKYCRKFCIDMELETTATAQNTTESTSNAGQDALTQLLNTNKTPISTSSEHFFKSAAPSSEKWACKDCGTLVEKIYTKCPKCGKYRY